MTVIPLPEWLPDLPAHNNPGLTVCTNVLPVSARYYAPVPKLSNSGVSIERSPKGAFTARDSAGNVSVFAGHWDRLSKITAGSATAEDVSGATYSQITSENWRFVQYGELVIATNFTDVVQSYDLGSSTDFAELSVPAPRARHLAIWNNFLVLGNTEDDTQAVRWSAIDDPTDFPTLGSSDAKSKQSDQQILAGDGGWIQALTGAIGNAVGLVFQERALWSVNYVGDPLVFTFDQVEGAKGTSIPNSVIHYGSIVAYWGGDGFYIYDGVSSKPIGNDKVDQFFLEDYDSDSPALVSATADPQRKLFLWRYASADGEVRVLVYNWSIGRWSLIDYPSLGLALAPVVLFKSAGLGYTVDTADNSGLSIESSTISADDRFWAGGPPALAAFGHRRSLSSDLRPLSFFTGLTMAAEIETGELDLGEGRRASVSGLRPMCDTDAVDCSIGYRNKQSDAVTYTTATQPGADGFAPQRISTRFPRAKFEIAEDEVWTKFSAYEPRFKPEGTR